MVKSVLFCVASVIVYIVDIVTDAVLAYTYYEEGDHIVAFHLTLAFVIFPLLISNIYDSLFIVEERTIISKENESGNQNRDNIHNPNVEKCICLLLAFPLCLGVVSRLIRKTIYEVRGRKKELKEHNAIVMLIAIATETSSQLVLQIYLLMIEEDEVSFTTWIWRIFAMVTSILGVVWSVLDFKYTHKASKKMTSTRSFILFSCIKCLEFGSRITLLALFATTFHGFVILAGAIHWLTCTLAFSYITKSILWMSPLFFPVVYLLIFTFIDIDYLMKPQEESNEDEKNNTKNQDNRSQDKEEDKSTQDEISQQRTERQKMKNYLMGFYYIVFHVENIVISAVYAVVSGGASFIVFIVTIIIAVLHTGLLFLYSSTTKSLKVTPTGSNSNTHGNITYDRTSHPLDSHSDIPLPVAGTSNNSETRREALSNGTKKPKSHHKDPGAENCKGRRKRRKKAKSDEHEERNQHEYL